MQQAFVNLRSGRPSRLKPPVANYRASLTPAESTMLDQLMACTAVGSGEAVRQAIRSFIDRTGVDELMIASQIFDHRSRLRSYEITASLFSS
jgi:alkanesulfonate monooxygenase SsuD/methylene tetrahydromethanopterin reductase-like flavin-dependent oxidoreductase (luciferase family)